ncbi:hypothetical protein CJF31_00009389 [Rutstroemia sp. NJR-2017a BVV2]|nr:hypothetical protein CJF31_00009389 [Rutstroemia sp. NJR-2017a BVV2]
MSLSFSYNVIILILFTYSVQAWNCWLPNAVGFDNVGMKPCNATLADTTEGSACCDPKDSCSTSGMCLGRSGYVYRGGCTDSTFGSENCPSFCLTDPILGTKYKKSTNIYSCGTEGMFTATFCCESFATPAQSCCGSTFVFPGSGPAFPPGHDAELALISSATHGITTTTATAAGVTVTATVEKLVSAIITTDISGDTITSSSTSLATAATGDSDGKISKSSSNSAAKSNSSDLGMVIGAGVGIPFGCIALVLLGFLLWRERRLRKLDAAPVATDPTPSQSVASRKSGYMPTTRSVDDEKMMERDAQGWEQQAIQLDGRSVYATDQAVRHELMDNGR